MVSRRKAKKRKVNHAPSTSDAVVAPPARSDQLMLRAPAKPSFGFTYLDDGAPVPPLRVAEAYGQLAQVALSRARFYGHLLAEAYEEQKTGAFWDDSWAVSPGEEGEPYKTGEYIRALVQLEAAERDRAERLLGNAMRIGIEARNEEMRRDAVATMVGALRNFVQAQGLTEDDQTRRMMQQAIIDARRSVLAHDPAR